MTLLSLFLLALVFSTKAQLRCDYETTCSDFIIDSNWGITDGLHPRPVDHDHTLNTSAGHYVFYAPQSGPQFKWAEIKTTNWLQPSTERVMCFHMWYYTPRISMPFTIQLVQGDDEQLTRIPVKVPGKDPSSNDWTAIKLVLLAEKIKIFVRLNASSGALAFDDFSVNFCDQPRPEPPKVMFTCDFESSCSDNFESLPNYPYQWSVERASDAVKKEGQAPSVDYSYGNASGHYAWLPNAKLIHQGNVGHLATLSSFNITANESYCLNFEYYGFGRSYTGNLAIYAWMSDDFNSIQLLWPLQSSGQYVYTTGIWTWGTINLPVGHYNLLFRIANTDNIPRSFSLDNIDITSCEYPAYTLDPDDDSLLSFSCNFDDMTMCDMENGDRFSKPPSFNYTVLNGDTIPNRDLGPTRDHTSNSSSGGFLFWNRQLPFVSWDNGRVHPSKTIAQNLGMCLRFAYYVKSLAIDQNATRLEVSAGGCYAVALWILFLDDSQGWREVTVPVKEFACMETFYFDVNQVTPVAVSVAFDDIEIKQCSSFVTTTTTTTTTRSTTTSTTSISTTPASTSTTVTNSSSSSTTSAISISTSQSSPRPTSQGSGAQQMLNVNILLTLCLLSLLFSMTLLVVS